MADTRNELNILLWGPRLPFPLTPPILLFFHQELDQLDCLILETRGWRNAAEMDGFPYCLCGAVRKQQNGKEIGN